MEVCILISDFKGNENVNDISNSVFQRQIKAVGTNVRPFGTSIREFELSFLISGSLKDRETYLVNLPFIIFRFHFSFSCDTGKQYPKS